MRSFSIVPYESALIGGCKEFFDRGRQPKGGPDDAIYIAAMATTRTALKNFQSKTSVSGEVSLP